MIRNKLEAFVTEEFVTEYQETCDDLCSRYPGNSVRLPLHLIIAACKMIKAHSVINVCRDPDDNKFIECAVDAKCLYVVSGDKDLLCVDSYQDVRIVTVADFLDLAQDL